MKIKRILAFLLTIVAIFSFFACGEYNPALNGDKNNSNTNLPEGSVEQPKLDGDPTNDFTVRLRLNGESYIPSVAVNVYWNDGYNIHIAPIDKDGVATIDGLDGDYSVTLSSAPSGYAYDPNAYFATNDNRNIIIDMYDSGVVSGKGSALYSCHRVTGTGVYTVTINEDADDANEDGKFVDTVYFEFAPQINGTYTIESWVNVVDDDVNPVCLAYLGSSAYKYGEYKVTDVGTCGSYTRNFVHTIKIADENISSGGSQVFTFAITAETKSGVYPATYTFAIKRNGGFDYNHTTKTMIAPKFDWTGFDFDAFNALAGNRIVDAQVLYDENDPNSAVFDQRAYKVWEKSEGGDGLYHVYDPEKYPETDGYGPYLVAYISEPCAYLDRSLTTIELAGNSALTVSNGTENYKQFIEGFAAVAGGGYYCIGTCPCHQDSMDDEGNVNVPIACTPSCTNCSSLCTRCPEELMGKVGYAQKCNADGVVPVTPELKDFLQKFAIQRQYFADGEGHVDRTGVYAYEDSQWLFACGYYE